MIDVETAGLVPLLGALPTPAAAIDADSGRVVVVNQLFAALFPRLAPLDVATATIEHDGVGAPGSGSTEAPPTPQEQLCRGCGQLAEIELAVSERLDSGGSSMVLVTCGAGTATALEIELRGLLADVEETVLLLDDDGIVRFASDPFESLVGRSGVGSPAVELFDEMDREDVDRLVVDSLAHPGRRLVVRGRLILAAGATCWVEAIARGMAVGASPAGVILGLRVVTAASHLGVVAASQTAPGRLGPEQIVQAFRELTPSEKAEVIRSLRS